MMGNAVPEKKNLSLRYIATLNNVIISCTFILCPHLTLKMTLAQDVETSVTNNSPSQDSFHLDDQIPSIESQ